MPAVQLKRLILLEMHAPGGAPELLEVSDDQERLGTYHEGMVICLGARFVASDESPLQFRAGTLCQESV